MGGHFRAGETLAQAIREADEEIGLGLRVPDLTRLGQRFAGGDGRADNEVQQVFAARSDLPLSAYRLHEHEVDALVSIPLRDALALFEGRTIETVGHEVGRGQSRAIARPVTVAEFAAGEIGGYAARALRSLGEVVVGGAPELFELR